MTKLISFDDALKAAGGKDCSILLGNGFSSRYFSYRSLLDKADLTADDPVRVLFDRLKTVYFERVVKAPEGAAEVELAYGNGDHAKQLVGDAGRVREALVHAIRGTHPAHREEIEDVIPSCVAFLSPFDEVFTLNYDLLLNWVGLSDEAGLTDGFGLGGRRNGFQGPFKTDAYCRVYNIHGGLHLSSASYRTRAPDCARAPASRRAVQIQSTLYDRLLACLHAGVSRSAFGSFVM